MVPIADCVSADEQRNGEVHVPATAGGSITAVVLGSGNTGVLLANMNRGDFCQWRPFADHLLQHGYRVLMFNYSADSPTVDVTATADVLRRKGAEHLFLIGASMGGTAALDAAAHLQPPVAGVVSLSAPQTYLGSDALKAMPLLTVPVMFIAAGNDQPFTDDARLLHDACAAKDKTLSYEPGSSHGTALLSEDVRRRIDAFLSGH
jgi:pimeloyl-ACP methyl ester carboxylesterase